MNISQPIKQETKTESDLTVKRVEEDRGLATQVKLWKKTLSERVYAQFSSVCLGGDC